MSRSNEEVEKTDITAPKIEVRRKTTFIEKPIENFPIDPPQYCRPVFIEIVGYIENKSNLEILGHKKTATKEQTKRNTGIFEIAKAKIHKERATTHKGLTGMLKVLEKVPEYLDAALINEFSQKENEDSLKSELNIELARKIEELTSGQSSYTEKAFQSGLVLCAIEILKFLETESDLMSSDSNPTFDEINSQLEDKFYNINSFYIALRCCEFSFNSYQTQIDELKAKSKGGAKSNKDHLFNLFIEWAFEQQGSFQFRSTTAAANYFVDKHLSKHRPALYKEVSANTPRNMVTKLRRHCKENNLENPFTS